MSEEQTKIVPRAAPARAGSITFRCANGHRIDVPARLAGKRGACSKCGIAVVIPAASAAAAGAPGEEPAARAPRPALEVPEGGPAAAVPGPVIPPQPVVPEPSEALAGLFESLSAEESGVGDVVPRDAAADLPQPQEVIPGTEHPTAQLLARLWMERAHGGVVELHVAGGNPILPEWYEPRWSGGTHALFASQAADGTVTLTAVAWESIQKIVVRGVDGLPDGMFE